MPERLPPGIGLAVLAALLFGLSTPAAGLLLAHTSPLMLSALLYLGSGGGLALLALPRWRAQGLPRPGPGEGRPLAGAILLGGVLAPVCLFAGVQAIGAARASLLLNLEGVFTALIAWRLFREATDAQVASGMACVVIAAALLGWPEAGDTLPSALAGIALPGPWLVVLACLCWGLDNNLTRSVSHLDAQAIALCKGLTAGAFNLLLAWLHGAHWPAPLVVLLALLTGFLGYGLSLVAYVRAQALLGAARTAAWFGLAPFAGAAAALLLLHETAPQFLGPAATLLALGLYLHVHERHVHWHQHEALAHRHRHHHDLHHQHAHDFAWDGREPHDHAHVHPPLAHSHAHFPDLHHRHAHLADAQTAGSHGSTAGPAIADGSTADTRVDARLRQAWQATAYRVDGDPPLVLRIGERNPALATLMRSHGCACAAYLTACNPLGKAHTDAENAQRQQALEAELQGRGLPLLRGAGEADAGDWPAEASVLVPGLERAAALDLGRRWQQLAILWCAEDAVPQLLRVPGT